MRHLSTTASETAHIEAYDPPNRYYPLNRYNLPAEASLFANPHAKY